MKTPNRLKDSLKKLVILNEVRCSAQLMQMKRLPGAIAHLLKDPLKKSVILNEVKDPLQVTLSS